MHWVGVGSNEGNQIGLQSQQTEEFKRNEGKCFSSVISFRFSFNDTISPSQIGAISFSPTFSKEWMFPCAVSSLPHCMHIWLYLQRKPLKTLINY